MGRSEGGNQDFRDGQAVGDAVSVVLGAKQALDGLAMAAAGGTFEIASIGTATPVAVPATAAGALIGSQGALAAGTGLKNLTGALFKNGTDVPNPDGSKGKPDHQTKVEELTGKAKGEAKTGEQVLRERKIQGQDSNRRPDVQIVDKNGRTRKVFEAERKPNSTRNRRREEEYDRLGVERETHRVP